MVDDMLATLGDKVADSRKIERNATGGEYWKKGYYRPSFCIVTGALLRPILGVLWSQGHIRSPWPSKTETGELHDRTQGKGERA